MEILLKVTPSELDFIARRMTSGKMSFALAKTCGQLMDKLVAQANDKSLQGLLEPPVEEPPKEK